MTKPSEGINVSDVGPIRELHIPVPPGGGVVVLRGANGSGKSHALNAVESLVTKNGEVPVRDGALRAEVQAFGATLRIARRTQRLGELEVAALEGKFSVADIVDPGLQDPLANDARRIKALVQLASDGTISREPFYELLNNDPQFDEYIGTHVPSKGDLVQVVATVKRDLEKQARDFEERCAGLQVQIKNSQEFIKDIDVTAPSDEQVLYGQLESCIQNVSRMESEIKSAEANRQRREEAERALQAAEIKYSGPTSAQASIAVVKAVEELNSVDHAIADLERALSLARVNQDSKAHDLKLAETVLEQAMQHECTVHDMREILNTSYEIQGVPTPDDLEVAQQDKQRAQSAVMQGALIRRALVMVDKISELHQNAVALHENGEFLRNAAQNTDNILTGAVKKLNCPLFVKAGRLVTNTDRGEELYADLSRGEQYTIAIAIAVDAVGSGGIIVLDQEAWEGLDPANRHLIAEQVENTGVVVLTAECSNDECIVPGQYEAYPLP